jgi:hypothetical protein
MSRSRVRDLFDSVICVLWIMAIFTLAYNASMTMEGNQAFVLAAFVLFAVICQKSTEYTP